MENSNEKLIELTAKELEKVAAGVQTFPTTRPHYPSGPILPGPTHPTYPIVK